MYDGGYTMSKSLREVLDDRAFGETEETRSGDEIVNDIIKKAGLEVV